MRTLGKILVLNLIFASLIFTTANAKSNSPGPVEYQKSLGYQYSVNIDYSPSMPKAGEEVSFTVTVTSIDTGAPAPGQSVKLSSKHPVAMVGDDYAWDGGVKTTDVQGIARFTHTYTNATFYQVDADVLASDGIKSLGHAWAELDVSNTIKEYIPAIILILAIAAIISWYVISKRGRKTARKSSAK